MIEENLMRICPVQTVHRWVAKVQVLVDTQNSEDVFSKVLCTAESFVDSRKPVLKVSKSPLGDLDTFPR